jgi:hypothetical protein
MQIRKHFHFDSKKNHWVKLDENWDWVECDEPTFKVMKSKLKQLSLNAKTLSLAFKNMV